MDDLLWAGGDAQAAALREGRTTAPELLEAVLARIARVDPQLNAFRAVFADEARAAARAAQERLDAGERTPLLGVPIAVKDDVDVAGDATGFGGRPQYPPAERDSEMVARLRAAGAVIVGRTNVPERCMWPFTETLARGATRNPWSLDHTPGGSSGGTGAAVAAGLVGVATGSDGGGSIRIPAALCGLVGIKTTRDLVATAPSGEIWHGLSVFGPLGRTVADAAAMLDVIAADGAATGEADGGSYRAAADADPGRLRIALAWNGPLGPSPIERQRRAAVRETAERLRALGHEVVERELPVGVRAFAQFLVRYLRGAGDDVAGLPHPEWLERRGRAMRRHGRLVPDRALRWARAGEADVHAALDPFLREFDVVLQPSLIGPPWRIGAFHGRGALATILGVALRIPTLPLWNLVGYPVVSLPVGRDRAGLPMAVQLAGAAGSERRLLSLAGQLERERPWVGDRPPLD
ncbi:amidase [Patulibacter defluvii]|uniref:amidase n=1 Tax=Patulibacter defluvii TaxID=3095358 RepID=UPI002A764F78|nr:amidase [Patulibacter sp. DM4]